MSTEYGPHVKLVNSAVLLMHKAFMLLLRALIGMA